MDKPALVSLTFDDGLRCQFEQAVPILDRHGFPATFFLVAKATLRVVVVAVGTAYFLSTFYLVVSVPELTTTQMVIGWYGTALGQLAIAMILVGIGLGVISIRFGKEKPE
jgi:hypothetical protein